MRRFAHVFLRPRTFLLGLFLLVGCADATAPWSGPCWLVKDFTLTTRDGATVVAHIVQPLGSATPYDPCPTQINPGWRRVRP